MSGNGFPGAGERRAAPRFNISLPLTFTVSEDGRAYAATVDNLSLGGMLLLTELDVEHGTDIVVHLPVGAEAVLDVEARIVRTARVGALGELGVAFLTLGDEQLQRVAEIVDARAAESGKRR